MNEQARKSLSISFRVDSGVIEHNNRKIVAKNVDRARTCNNITYRKQNIKQKYAELFGQALSEYNAKQTQKSRRIPDYYEHVLKSAKGKPFYEVVVQFGDDESLRFHFNRVYADFGMRHNAEIDLWRRFIGVSIGYDYADCLLW